MSAGEVRDMIIRGGLVAIVRGSQSIDEVVSIGRNLDSVGWHAIEVPTNSVGWQAKLEHLRRHVGASMMVGAGTVLSHQMVEESVAAGAQFVVSPSWEPVIAQACSELDIFYLPGVMTPTEIRAALREGLSVVKLFPAGALGPRFIRELRGPFPDIGIVATGGVDGDNASAFIAAGASALAVGSYIAPAHPLDDGELLSRGRSLVDVVSGRGEDARA